MDFSEIGVRSRKTGLKAKENVRRDENNMEDVEDFFRDDQTTQIQQQPSHALQPSQSTQPTATSNITNPPQGQNGRIIFPAERSRPSSSQREIIRNSPLQSPLPARPSRGSRGDEDLFTDAYEEPMVLDTVEDQDNGDDMDIDDESKGVIRLVNEPQQNDDDDYGYDISFPDDDQRVPVPNPPRKPSRSKGEKLFISSDEESYNKAREKSIEQRHLELERNMTVRSTSNKSSSRHYSVSSTPKQYNKVIEEPVIESPLKSILDSPLRPSSRKIASLSKSIALNKSRQHQDLPSDGDSSSVSDDDSFEDDDYKQDQNDNNVDDEEPSEESSQEPSTVNEESEGDESLALISGKNRKRSISADSESDSNRPLPPQPSKNGRQNKFQRSVFTSPGSRQHKIDVDQLRKQQSRSISKSNKPAEQPTRRSSRVRIPPLAFWRNERAVYEKNRKEQIVPSLKEIITVDEVPEPPKRSRAPSKPSSKRPSRQTSRVPSRTRKPKITRPQLNSLAEEDENDGNDDAEEENKEPDDLEEGRVQRGELKGSEWLRNGFLKVDTFEGHGSDVKSNRLIAWAPGTENFSNSIIADQDNFKLAILFDKNREFIAAGMMLIPPNGVKSLKSTDTTYFVFYCISGVIEVTLSGNVFLIKKGCSLEVPMGNFYQFVNKGKKDATLFFVQTRGHDVDDWDEE